MIFKKLNMKRTIILIAIMFSMLVLPVNASNSNNIYQGFSEIQELSVIDIPPQKSSGLEHAPQIRYCPISREETTNISFPNIAGSTYKPNENNILFPGVEYCVVIDDDLFNYSRYKCYLDITEGAFENSVYIDGYDNQRLSRYWSINTTKNKEYDNNGLFFTPLFNSGQLLLEIRILDTVTQKIYKTVFQFDVADSYYAMPDKVGEQRATIATGLNLDYGCLQYTDIAVGLNLENPSSKESSIRSITPDRQMHFEVFRIDEDLLYLVNIETKIVSDKIETVIIPQEEALLGDYLIILCVYEAGDEFLPLYYENRRIRIE